MSESVFSNTRTIIQPEFVLPDGFLLDQPQVMDGKNLLTGIQDASIPLVIFDPQYRSVLGKLQYGNEGERQKGRSLLPQMNDDTIVEFMKEIGRILIPSGHLFLWVDKLLLIQTNWEDFCSLKSVDMIVWNKAKIGMGYRTRRCSEYLLILQKPPVRAKGVWTCHNIPDVWTEKADKSHTHAKPIGLLEKLISAVTSEGDIVVDPSAGGYNVMRAALKCNRHFLGCDLLPLVTDA